MLGSIKQLRIVIQHAPEHEEELKFRSEGQLAVADDKVCVR